MTEGCQNMGLSFKYLFNYEIGFAIIIGFTLIVGMLYLTLWILKKKDISKYDDKLQKILSFFFGLLNSSIESSILLNIVSILLETTIYELKYSFDILHYLASFLMILYLLFYFF